MSISRSLVWAHRWLGVVLCLFFCTWFISGAVMIYVPFPSLSHAAALAPSRAVDTAQIATSPPKAIEATGARLIQRLRLRDVNGQATYIVQPSRGVAIAVRAVDGRVVERVDAATARAVAEQFAGFSVRKIEGPLDNDQWLLARELDPFRPFYRLEMTDAHDTTLYVSARTGEVLQRTTARERAWNYIGSVVHWIYPAIIRRHPQLWDHLVWWLALAGVVVVLVGAWLGLTRIAGRQRNGTWQLSVYRGWLKWHHVLGVFSGVLVLTWVFSGWLSVDHGRFFSPPHPGETRVSALRGTSLEQAAGVFGPSSFVGLSAFKEAEIRVMAGVAFLSTTTAGARHLYVVAHGELTELRAVPEALVRIAVGDAWPDTEIIAVEHPGPDDAYSTLRKRALPPSAIRVILNDDSNTWVHIDAGSGAVLSVMDRSARIRRWLFNGLHSFDFPGLVVHRPLWDYVIMAALVAGFTFMLTGVVIGVKRLRTTCQRRSPRAQQSDVSLTAE